MMPRPFSAFAVACTVLVAGCSSTPGDDGTGTSEEDLSSGRRADQATNAFIDLFLDAQTGNLRESHPFRGSWALPSDYWKYAQAFDAVLYAVERSNGSEFERHAQQLFTGWHDRPSLWHRGWFDDENWIALALLHAHRVMKEPNGHYRDLAVRTFDDIWTRGATRDAAGRFTGIWESIEPGPAFHTKAAVSNFGPALTAALLRRREAKEIYVWAREHLSDPSTGEVFDHIERNGSTVKWQYTYNYGVAIGAALHLYRADGDARHLEDAYGYADRLVHHMIANHEGRPILHDGCEARCESAVCDCSAFKGIGYRYLAELYGSRADAGNPRYAGTIAAMHEVLSASAQAVWAARSSRVTFPSDWGGGARSYASIGSEASAITTLNVAARDGVF
jgi:predicted alpha-1,6-mannanase (GH76 family)